MPEAPGSASDALLLPHLPFDCGWKPNELIKPLCLWGCLMLQDEQMELVPQGWPLAKSSQALEGAQCLREELGSS